MMVLTFIYHLIVNVSVVKIDYIDIKPPRQY